MSLSDAELLSAWDAECIKTDNGNSKPLKFDDIAGSYYCWLNAKYSAGSVNRREMSIGSIYDYLVGKYGAICVADNCWPNLREKTPLEQFLASRS
jgi:hypothetical protein